MHPGKAKTALTPVMATVTLLCIAIAVSLATLAWINGLPTPQMYTEDLQATNHKWGPNYAYVDVTLHNNGTQSLNLKSVTVNSQPATVIYIAGSSQINTGESTVLRIANRFTSGANYQLTFQTAKGNKFSYTANTETATNPPKPNNHTFLHTHL